MSSLSGMLNWLLTNKVPGYLKVVLFEFQIFPRLSHCLRSLFTNKKNKKLFV